MGHVAHYGEDVKSIESSRGEKSHLKDARDKWEDNKREKKLQRLDSPGSGLGKGEGQTFVNVAPHLWVQLYAGNLTSYRNVTFSHAGLHITSLLCPTE